MEVRNNTMIELATPDYPKAMKDIASVIQALEGAPEAHLAEIVRHHTIPTIKHILAEVAMPKKTLWQKIKSLIS